MCIHEEEFRFEYESDVDDINNDLIHDHRVTLDDEGSDSDDNGGDDDKDS